MPAIVEGWIDKVLAPPWAFKFKQLWGNYGYPIAVSYTHLRAHET